MNIRFKERGHIEIDKPEHKQLFGAKVNNIFTYHNYNIFSFFGNCNFKDEKGLPSIIIKNVSRELYDYLISIKAIRKSVTYDPSKAMRIRLDNFAIVSRKRLSEIKSVDYGKLTAEQRFLQCSNLALNDILDAFEPPSKMEERFDAQ